MAAPHLLMRAGEPTDDAIHFPEVMALYTCLKDGGTHTFYTSGTTGPPKPIEFSAAQMIWSAKLSLEALSLSQGFTSVLAMPLSFVAGKMMVVRAFVAKGNLWYVPPSLRPFNPPLPDMDFVALTPAQVHHSLAFSADVDQLKRVKVVLIGGGILSATSEAMLQQFPNKVFHSYGMTETLTHCALRNIAPLKESLFRPHHPSISFKVEDGILSINYPILTYGFLQTNDVVKMGNDGFMYLGRRDDLINLGGLKLFPSELEQRLPPDLFSGRAWFIGAQEHPVWGQVPWLWLEGENDIGVTFETLSAYLIGKHKLYGYSLVPTFSRTPTGKIKKTETCQLAFYTKFFQ
jgi:O-succinylbenzoic acid--CoA ligase